MPRKKLIGRIKEARIGEYIARNPNTKSAGISPAVASPSTRTKRKVIKIAIRIKKIASCDLNVSFNK
jgi:hypothetical protein